MGAFLGSLPASVRQLHVYINTARLSFRCEGSGKIIETCFQSSTGCVYTMPVKSTNKKKIPGRVKVDMTSSQLSTATVHILLMAKANHRIVCPSLHVFNDMGAHSHGRVANTQCLVTTQQPVCVPGASHFLAVLLSYMQVCQRAGKNSDV